MLEKDVLINQNQLQKIYQFVKKVKHVEECVLGLIVIILFQNLVRVSAHQIQFVKVMDVNLIQIVIKMIVQKNALIQKNVKMLLNIHVMNVQESFYVKEKIVSIHLNQVIFAEINHVKLV